MSCAPLFEKRAECKDTERDKGEKMKIKIVKLLASPSGVLQPGTVIDIDDEQGARIVMAGAGVCVDERPKEIKKTVNIETADIEIPEKQVIVEKKKKKKR